MNLSVFKNKHIAVALIVAPLLAIVSYFAVDYLVAERPHKARANQDYQLVALPNCRYPSGVCELKNGNFVTQLRFSFSANEVSADEASANDSMTLALSSSFPLQGVKVALAEEGERPPSPRDMSASDSTGKAWVLPGVSEITGQTQIYLVLAADGARYFGETSTAFVHYETSYHKDFRK